MMSNNNEPVESQPDTCLLDVLANLGVAVKDFKAAIIKSFYPTGKAAQAIKDVGITWKGKDNE
jgi:hypothetical protein